ncbi:MAG: polyphosphate kinase 1 [Deltaproteobacteria bacterium]|nr:polyphosphate kinase 1 [Deltaproteobacteria bacterium]
MTQTPLQAPALDSPGLYINRELSWLAFNTRVLEEARDASVPLLERLKFLCIASSNLDEFFMVRVASLKEQLSQAVQVAQTPDGMTPLRQLEAIGTESHRLVTALYDCFNHELVPELKRHGISLLGSSELGREQKTQLRGFFRREVMPVLTPLAVDPGHPFPHLKNKTLNLAIAFDRLGPDGKPLCGVVQVPSMLDRLVPVTNRLGQRAFAFLEDVISLFADELFPGLKVVEAMPFRVTRNWHLELDEEEAEDLLTHIQRELRKRDKGRAVRLEQGRGRHPSTQAMLARALGLSVADVYNIDGPINLADLMWLATSLPAPPELRYPATDLPVRPDLEEVDLFERIAEQDLLLHHPYESFQTVVDFIRRAAEDPQVLAIKQTLYRTSIDSPVVKALARAAELGKQVTVIVELKARFDEEVNIGWARALEAAGVHVVYGLLGFKTHCKVLMVVRREKGLLRRYIHLGTGNYNPNTSRIYTDLSLFTANEEFGEDCSALFNLLTGYSNPPGLKHLKVAPIDLHDTVLAAIEREAARGADGRIVAKMNSLVDAETIRALYRASQAGVKVDLVVRGICCLRPGVPGVSDNIRVLSVVDRFLEHSRVYVFGHGERELMYVASADWMPRNFLRRVEVAWPVLDADVRARIREEILATMLRDTVKNRLLQPGGSYRRMQPEEGDPNLRSQARFTELAQGAHRAAKVEVARHFISRRARERQSGAQPPSPSPSVPRDEKSSA